MAEINFNFGVDFINFKQCSPKGLNIILLGSVGDAFLVPPALNGFARVFGIDALSPQGRTAFVAIKAIISVQGGPATFIERRNGQRFVHQR